METFRIKKINDQRFQFSQMGKDNGVRNTEKINFYRKNFTQKKAWFVTESNIFYFEKK